MVISADVKINLQETNAYFASRYKKIAVAVGTFEENNKRRKPAEQQRVIKKHKVYGYYVQTLRTEDNITNATVAYLNIKGHGKTPKRDYLTRAFNRKNMKANNFDFLRAFYVKNPNKQEIYRRLGNLGQASVKRAILDFKTPPNSKKTIALKGFNSPLIHTQQLLKSINYHPIASAFKYFGQEAKDKREI